jgi:hypothetical protein
VTTLVDAAKRHHRPLDVRAGLRFLALSELIGMTEPGVLYGRKEILGGWSLSWWRRNDRDVALAVNSNLRRIASSSTRSPIGLGASARIWTRSDIAHIRCDQALALQRSRW